MIESLISVIEVQPIIPPPAQVEVNMRFLIFIPAMAGLLAAAVTASATPAKVAEVGQFLSPSRIADD